MNDLTLQRIINKRMMGDRLTERESMWLLKRALEQAQERLSLEDIYLVALEEANEEVERWV